MEKKTKKSKEDNIKTQEYLYIPDIPEDPLLGKKKSRNEEEIEFLERILEIQRAGGWGNHLDYLIYNRIKILKNE